MIKKIIPIFNRDKSFHAQNKMYTKYRSLVRMLEMLIALKKKLPSPTNCYISGSSPTNYCMGFLSNRNCRDRKTNFEHKSPIDWNGPVVSRANEILA